MIEPCVSKPSLQNVATADENREVASAVNREPKGDGCGTCPMVLDDASEDACTLAQKAGSEIAARLGPSLGRREVARLVTAFRRTLLPRRPPGRKRRESITAAHEAWKTGVCGVALYRSHIPNWEKHNRYRRQCEARALMEAIRTRERRERKTQST